MSEPSYLADAVQDVEAVLVPAEDPTLPEEAAEQPQLPVSGSIPAGRTGPRKQLELRNLRTGGQVLALRLGRIDASPAFPVPPAHLCVEQWFEQPRVLHLSSDVRPPQSESRTSSKHLKVALFTESWQEAGAEPPAAVNTHTTVNTDDCKQQLQLE